MNRNISKFRLTVNGQDITTGDIDDGRPERMWVCPAKGYQYSKPGICPYCWAELREETDAEYWARVEAMTPKSADDLL